MNTKVIVVGSIIGFMISLLDENQKNKTQRILKKVLSTGGEKEVDLSNNVWKTVTEYHIGSDFLFDPTIAIESLYFSFIDEMEEVFGDKLTSSIWGFNAIYMQHGIDKKYIANSYKFADELRDCINEKIGDAKK